ncbi:beta-agarase [Rubellicoccus peritrichatus]|uniref:Beta-agarase n=1 Tax=Rubellicoccus peritrichatus TaxID=3080537 RepID=A0AAQ3LGZ3_9BACT|nr:beta-agarase [Puniceicoccus sp. CR14]WOO43690.1 beta-agarase [Puniceicoccus sp. CR14]
MFTQNFSLILLIFAALMAGGCLKTSSSGDSSTPESNAAKLEVEPRMIDWSKPYIVVEPHITRSVQGISEVDRERYFAICDSGGWFPNRVKDQAMYDYLVNDLEISFGRELGPVKWLAKDMKEDPERPQHADLTKLKQKKHPEPDTQFYADFGPNLNVAAHGNHNAFPEFMGRVDNEDSLKHKYEEYMPENVEAAAELSAAVMKYNYTDFTRPRYYEPINEPHWSFYSDPHLAKWHLATMEAVKESTPEVLVGGPCSSVCYFYRNDYKGFKGMKDFIDETDGSLDFYSYHTYDYLRWRDGELRGRLQSGLPLEGTLDLIPNYTYNQFGEEMDIVVSEHGGYIGSQPKGEFDGEAVASEIMQIHHPDADPDSWEYEMQKRSIVNFGHVSSIISNTLAFMDHPHTLQKAVPFILFNTWNWDPKYYAGMYVPYEYTDKEHWVETDLTTFYKFFRGVDGRRVKALCSDPDLQVRAFVNGSKLFLAINNQSFESETVDLYGIETPTVEVRSLSRNNDFTTNYSEKTIDTPEVLTVAGRESLMIIADYGSAIKATGSVNEIVCYGDDVAKPLEEATFTINVPTDNEIDYAQLRVAVSRSPEASREPVITLNGKTLDVPMEDSAERYTDKEYAMTKLIYLDPADLEAVNTVTVSFPDSNEGAVGSAVIRVAAK